MRYSLILLVLAVLLSLGIRFLADPIRQAQLTANPARDLQGMVNQDPELGTALAQADQGNLSELTAWINRAEPEDRYRLAVLLERIICRNDGSAKKDVLDINLAYRYRNRLRAFTNLSTGDVHRDNELDNLLAYTLATAHAHPSEQDLALAESLEPRLRNIPLADNSDEFLDTVGCIEYQQGHYDQAEVTFAKALHLARASHESQSPQSLSFYQRRLDAAVHNAQLQAAVAAHPEAPAPSYLPLPPDEDAATAPPEAAEVADAAGSAVASATPSSPSSPSSPRTPSTTAAAITDTVNPTPAATSTP